MNRTRQILGANLSSLMNSSSELASAPAVERATAQKGLKVGRSTVQRVKDGDTTVNLDYIEVFAKVFQKEPWQLLHPAIGEMASSTDAKPTLAQALEVVLDAMAQSTAKAELKQLLPMLVETNAAAYRARLGELLGQSLQKQPSIADKLLAIPSEVESPRLSQRATEK
jgi:hypothetical protein